MQKKSAGQPLSPLLHFAEAVQPFLREETPLRAIAVRGETVQGADLGGLQIRAGLFQGCVFSRCMWAGASFQNVEFVQCDFSNSIWTDAFLEGCRFQNCRCIGADFGGSVFRAFSVEQSNFQYAGFDRTRMAGAVWADSDFTEASFTEMRWKRLEIKRCQLVCTRFFHTPLAGLDFSDSQFAAPVVSAPPVELRGAVVSMEQAVGLAGLLGVHVKT